MVSEKLFSVLFVIFIETFCQDADGTKGVQPKGTYTSRRENNDERPILPNDFILGSSTHNYGSHYHHHGYHGPLNYNQNYQRTYMPQHQEEYESYLNSSGIPVDFAKTLNEYNVSDLLLNFVDDEPEIIEKSFIASRFGGDSDANETERSSAPQARLAKCMPELRTVRIAESNDPNVFFIPECTRIERCGGCCSHSLLSCQPIETETVTLSVIKTEYSGGKKLKYVGKEPILIEKHTKCKCNCKVKAEDCNSYQEYREPECRCVCKNIDEEKKCYKKNSKKLWNPDLCACQCRDVSPCSTGYHFDFNECRCIENQVKRRYVLSENLKEEPDHL